MLDVQSWHEFGEIINHLFLDWTPDRVVLEPSQRKIEGALCGTLPYIKLALLQFELTKQLFSLELSLNTLKKGFTIPKTISDCKK